MFFQPPEKEPTNKNIVKSAGAQKSARRKRRKLEQKIKNKTQLLKKEKQRFSTAMSSWAENFSMGATWQLKHQLAHWKSKARALEYENNILRTTLREYYVNGKFSDKTEKTDDAAARNAENRNDSEEEVTEEEEEEGVEEEGVEEETENDQEEDETMEVSEEFLDFLKKNAEFRKLRQERQRIRKLEAEMPMKLLESCPDGPIDQKAEYQKLYGVHWEKIAALEMSMQSQYISECDRDKPVLWPTLPLRL